MRGKRSGAGSSLAEGQTFRLLRERLAANFPRNSLKGIQGTAVGNDGCPHLL